MVLWREKWALCMERSCLAGPFSLQLIIDDFQVDKIQSLSQSPVDSCNFRAVFDFDLSQCFTMPAGPILRL